VSGELDLLLEQDGVLTTTPLQAGSSYYVPPNVRHGVVTRTPCVLLDCFTPIREDFV
jgi:quercetin dioxygenase-like cupin family protein